MKLTPRTSVIPALCSVFLSVTNPAHADETVNWTLKNSHTAMCLDLQYTDNELDGDTDSLKNEWDLDIENAILNFGCWKHKQTQTSAGFEKELKKATKQVQHLIKTFFKEKNDEVIHFPDDGVFDAVTFDYLNQMLDQTHMIWLVYNNDDLQNKAELETNKNNIETYQRAFIDFVETEFNEDFAVIRDMLDQSVNATEPPDWEEITPPLPKCEFEEISLNIDNCARAISWNSPRQLVPTSIRLNI